jgi:peptidoglycan-associated lipoprotein
MKLGPKLLADLALAAMAAAALAACASHPPPPPVTPHAPPPQEGPPPPPGEEAPPPEATGAPVPGSARDFIINVGDRVYFDFNATEIRATPVLDGQSAWLRRYPDVRVRIEGNCDERGTREYNFALGARRADAVRAYLIAHGVSPGRITTISYGKEQPIDPGNDDAAWAKDRNAHTAITEDPR